MANQITVDIVADTRSLVAGVKQTNTQLNSLNQSVGKLKSAFGGIAAAFGFQVGIGLLKDAIQGYAEEEATFKKLANLYGEDAQKVIDGINKLSKGLAVDDGAIAQYFLDLAAATDVRFKPFYNDIVTQSVRLGTVLSQPPEQFITAWTKALKDGKITANEVAKLGIDLTEEQKKTFNGLTTTAERIKFLLDAAAQQSKDAEKFVSPWQRLTFQYGELKDMIGKALLPVLTKIVNWYKDLSPAQQDLVDKVAAFVIGLAALATVLAPLVIVGEAFVGMFMALRKAQLLVTAAQALMNLAFSPYLVVILAVIAAGVLLYKNWDTIKDVAGKLVDKLKGVWQWIKDNWSTLLTLLGGPIGAAITLITKNLDGIKSAFSNVFNAIKGLFSGDISAFTSFGRDLINGLVNGIKSMAMAPINAVKSIASGVTSAVKSIFGIKSPSKVFKGFGENIVQGLSLGIEGAQKLAVGSMADLSRGLSLTPNYGTASRGGVTVNINAGLGTDPYELGRAVRAALNKYDGVNG